MFRSYHRSVKISSDPLGESEDWMRDRNAEAFHRVHEDGFFKDSVNEDSTRPSDLSQQIADDDEANKAADESRPGSPPR